MSSVIDLLDAFVRNNVDDIVIEHEWADIREQVESKLTPDNSRSDEIALLNKLKHDMEVCDDVLADIDSWIERINAVIAQLRAVR